MRIFSLLTVLWCVLGTVSVASAAEPQNSSSQAVASSFSSELIRPSAIVGQDSVRVPASDRVDRHYSHSDSARDGDVTCFTMHTFLVKREDPHSDVIEPAGESTCLSGPRYSVRKVEEPAKVPSR